MDADPRRHAPTPKLQWVERWLARSVVADNHPAIVWIDDQLRADAFEWAENYGAPTLLLRPDPAAGLTAEHVATVRAFLAATSGPTDSIVTSTTEPS